MKIGWIRVGAFYQLVSSVGNYNETIIKSNERSLFPSEIKTNNYGNFLALKFTQENLTDFDNSTKDLNIDYLIFSNVDFKKIIKFAKNLNLSIRDIESKDIDESLREEIDEYILNDDYDGLLEFIEDNKILIKKLDLFFNNKNIFKIYDSGIVWLDTDLTKSTSFVDLLKSILEITLK
ncbi:MAG TPA: hypothetical protein HA306_01085 [Methanosarcina sp.]|nr:hypothetical protein [Methanosarcina sp.]